MRSACDTSSLSRSEGSAERGAAQVAVALSYVRTGVGEDASLFGEGDDGISTVLGYVVQ